MCCLILGITTSLLEDKTQMTEDCLSLHKEEIFVDEMSSDIDVDQVLNDDPLFVELNDESGVYFSEVNERFDNNFCNFEVKTEYPELPDFKDCLDDSCVLTQNCVCEFCGLLLMHQASLKKHVFLYHSVKFKSWFAKKYDVNISKVPLVSEMVKQKMREYEALIKIPHEDLSPKCKKPKRPRKLENNEAVANKSKGTGTRLKRGTGIRRRRGSPQIRESGKP